MSINSRRRAVAGLAVMLAAFAAVLIPGPAVAAGDTQPPTAPTNLHVSSVSFTWVQLAWSPSTDNSGWVAYDAELDTPTGPQAASSLTPNVGFGGLAAGQTYTARVWARDLARNTSAVVSVQFTTLPRTQPPPTAPANLRGVYVDGVLTAIAWDPSVFNGPVSYQGYTSATNSAFATSATSISIRDLAFIWCAVEPGGTYTFTIEAWGEHNYRSEHSAPLTVTIPGTIS
jgi:chitinase